ncbi:MAG: pyridoxal 5'-phosphate synthase glutaminase subunit PdxT [Dehalococcoidia bacterium]|nr:pyridoxal 5'-phosphate synthase glutaminase subunit PdxT [Dehalococcoidia bacterium]
MRIGVLALQGAFAEHITVLSRLGVETLEVRLPQQLANLDGLVIPGGESTTISRLMREYQLDTHIIRLALDGMAVMGTCAGMIVLATRVDSLNSPTLGLMDISVRRNAFGRQVDSFETDLEVPAIGAEPFKGIFIRAPVVTSVGPKVEVLCRLSTGDIVAVRQGKCLAMAFHPELTDDTRFHRYFINMVSGVTIAKSSC